MGNKKSNFINENYRDDPRYVLAADKFDILTFLSDNDVDYTMDGKNVGTDFIGVNPCPNCGDSRNHYGINIKKKYGSCFICKYHISLIGIICLYGKMSFEEAFKYLIEEQDENKDVEQRVKEIIYGQVIHEEHVYQTKTDVLPNSRLITMRDLRINPHLNTFFKEKKLNLWHVKRYGLRIGTEKKYQNYIIWPVWYKNRLVSYQRRNFKEKRYYNPKNLQHYIYGYDWIIPGNPLILVEGFLDYTRIDTYLRCYHPNNISITSGLLKSISNKQIQMIINAKPSSIIVMFDNDSWFDYWRIRNSFPFNVFFVIIPKGLDPNMMNWSQINNIFKKEILNVIS